MLKPHPAVFPPSQVPTKKKKIPINPTKLREKKRFGYKGPHVWCSVTWLQRLTAGRAGQNINKTAAELWIGLFSFAVTQMVEGGSSKAKVTGLIPREYTN